MSKIITVKAALEIMDSGATFSLTCVTYDRTRKKGGKLLEIEEARIDKKMTNDPMTNDGAATRPPTDFEAKLAALQDPDTGKNPNHQKWYTRNIRPLANGHPLTDLVKIHPPLLLQFNGMQVVP
jgi:hypothetical protein